MRFVNFSIGSKDSHFMSRVANEMAEEHHLEYACYNGSDLDADSELLLEAMEKVGCADFVTFKVQGDTSYMKRFDRILGVLEDNAICALVSCMDAQVTEANRHLFKGTDDEFELARAFYVLGGDENMRSLFMWAFRKFDGLDVEVPDPIRPPAQGLYYPGRDSLDIDAYLDSMDGSKLSIGILFYQKQWLNHNVANIDALIAAIEKRDAVAVPIFLQSCENDLMGSIGVKRMIRERLTREGEPVLDAIIETVSHSQLIVGQPGLGEQNYEDNFFETYGVPVIRTMELSRDRACWRDDAIGLTPSEITYEVVHPEFDGQIIAVPSCTTERSDDGTRAYVELEDRVERVADIACMWGALRRIPNSARRVAVLLYMYPPKTANAGGASCLDTFASVVSLLHRMRDDGYDVGGSIPETSKELVELLLSRLTNDYDWISEEDASRRCFDVIPVKDYEGWYRQLSDAARDRIEADWGRPPGDFYTVDGGLAVPGVAFGNIFVGFQPDRGTDIKKSYHDPFTVMPHQYLGFYRWLRHVFGAHAVVHMGTHGTLEWLPGKSVALSGDCCPDYVQDSLPDIYPYIIDNPGEGTQAKRRAAAVIVDHMIPPMVRSGGYDDLLELESAVQKYMDAGIQGQDKSLPMLIAKLREIVGRMDIYCDLKLDPSCTDEEFEARVDDLYDYIIEVKGNMIKDGLHILGECPEGDLLVESVYSLTRLDNGDVPSLRGTVARRMGLCVDDLLNNPTDRLPDGRLKGEALEEVEEADTELIRRMMGAGFDSGKCQCIAGDMLGEDEDLCKAVSFVTDFLVSNLRKTSNEIDSVMEALRGEYVAPGPSGCPTRGRAQLLPTGRNFYSLDPESIPWQTSWKIGKELADQMLERYIQEHGAYPRSIGIVVWATDTMKTGGDDVSYILWLMGLRPVWTGYAGRVKDIEVIPIEELGRPRIDVTLRISGLFRDTFPNIVNLIDHGVQMIANLNETDEENYLAANLRADIARSIAEGIPEDQARADASIRIFGDAPGTYGTGTTILIHTSEWKTVDDIGRIYQEYGQFAYGVGRSGEARPEAFRRRLESMDVTVKNSVTREYDMFDNDDVYSHLGGLNAAVHQVRGTMPMSVIGCSADTVNLRTRTIDEEGRYIFRSKINNPKWLNGLKRHGFKGAEEISNMTEYVFGWDATSDIIDPWMYQSIAERFLFDEETAEWFRDANPHAMHDTAARLLEAVGRGMWDPDEETRKQLEEIYADLESVFEGMQ